MLLTRIRFVAFVLLALAIGLVPGRAMASAGGDDCFADFNEDCELNIMDFVAFQDAFMDEDDDADCNDDD